MAGSASKSGPKPLQKNLSRRVSFNEATLAKSQDHPKLPSELEYIDTEAQTHIRPAGRCSSRFNSCCAWTSLVLGVLLLLSLLVGGTYFAFLQSNLPEVRLHRLDVYNLDVNNTNTDTYLTTDFEVGLNTTNQNGKIELSYSPLTASLSSEGINLGSVKIPAFRQKPSTTSDIKVRTAIKKSPVEESAAIDLEDNSNRHLMVIDVVLKGHIDFLLDGNRINGFPFKITCHNIDQSEIDNGHAPKCSVQMSPL